MFTEDASLDKKFTPYNVICVSILDSKLNLQQLAELITLAPTSYVLKSKKNNRTKVPYFGQERVIVGISYDDERRGIRVGGGQLTNLVGIDLQYAGKNIYMKVSRNNIVSMGVLNEDMGMEASRIFLSHLQMVNDIWIYFSSLKQEVKDATQTFVLSMVRGENGCVRGFDNDRVVKELKRVENGKVKNVDLKVAKYLTMFTYDFPNYNDFVYKIDRLVNLSLEGENFCYESAFPPRVSRLEIANSVYNYNLGVKLPLIHTTRELINLGKYILKYDNWSDPNTMYIVVLLSSLSNYKKEDVEKIFSKNTIRAHRFQINKCGSVRQTSPTSVNEALDVRNMLLLDIFRIIYDLEDS
jgi:hypothetical protein